MTPHDQSDDTLIEGDRTLYGALADVLIPSAEGMPSATEADVPGTWLDQALRARPDMYRALRHTLDSARDAPATPKAVLDHLAEISPADFESFAMLTAGAYYLNPSVRERIGYPGQEDRPATEDVDAYLDLLEHVVDRGPVCRLTPPEAGSTHAEDPTRGKEN
ncbi:hypothetical protein ABZ370_24535 [Streptomyces sp. NPDC005962]|uniref:hypothetical protein n=1 Tax=Streptomyces sp. NPDC005962 TaxID=3154466 RepID=UPI00340DA09C